MIKIKNLVKIYKTSRKESTTAINDVTLTLPNNGMIFIVGKSGSGKSTLLNMIGTLDNISDGDIYIDGMSIKNSSSDKLQEYRSSYLGFIFQDFLLLNEFTVRENVALALNISGIEDESLIDHALEQVDLLNEASKFPTELSGGQRQRVAIARALVKNPKLILCDEPTGNLDYKTSESILKFLKKQSEEKLVIVVSHNLEDAENYADRIIELFDGKVVSDTSKNIEHKNTYQEYDTHVLLPHHLDMTGSEVESLNNLVKEKKIKVYQNRGGFEPTSIVESIPNVFKLTSSHLTRKNRGKISQIFFRKNKHGTPYTMLMLTLLISLLYIFQVFITFNGNKSISKPSKDQAISVIKLDEQTVKGTLSDSLVYGMTDEEIDAYYKAGYEGNIYPIYNYVFYMGVGYLANGKITRVSANLKYNYLRETAGTVCCDEEFLTSIYGQNGKLKLHCGTLKDTDSKIIITDYTAKSLMIYSKNSCKTYEDVLEKYKDRVCAIIDTGYEERYKEVLKHGEEAQLANVSHSDYILQYSENELHIAFLKEVNNYLSFNYAFATKEEFYSNIYKINSEYFPTYRVYIETEDGVKQYSEKGFNVRIQTSKYDLKDNEIVMSYEAYKDLFGKEYTAITAGSFVPHTFKMTKYNENTDDSQLIYEEEFVITSLGSTTYVNSETYIALEKSRCMVYGLYFNNRDMDDIIYDVTDENGFIIYEFDTPIIPVVNTIIDVFKGFAILIIVLLIVAAIVYLISFGIGTIKKNFYEIGVLKALGTKNIDIGIIFITQIVIVGFGVILVSILGIKLFSEFSNYLLIKSFEDFMTLKIYELKIIPVKPSTMSFDLSIMFVVTLVSSIIPLVYLRKLKPLNILKGNKK